MTAYYNLFRTTKLKVSELEAILADMGLTWKETQGRLADVFERAVSYERPVSDNSIKAKDAKIAELESKLARLKALLGNAASFDGELDVMLEGR